MAFSKDIFELSGAPTGTTVQSARRVSDTVAELTLAYNGTDFDTDASLAVRVLASGHAGTQNLLADAVTVTAVTAPPAAPAGLCVEEVMSSHGTVRLSWNATSDASIIRYEMRYWYAAGTGTYQGPFAWITLPDWVPGGSTATYGLVTRAGVNRFRFEIRAVNSEGASAASNRVELSITRPR